MDQQNKPQTPWWQPQVALFLKLSGWIAVPPILGILLGKYLDDRYRTGPWLLITGAIAAFTVSIIMIAKIWFEETDKK